MNIIELLFLFIGGDKRLGIGGLWVHPLELTDNL